jgi:hypothetical protein
MCVAFRISTFNISGVSMMFIARVLVFCGAILFTGTIGAQTDLGSWNILNLRYGFNSKWSVFAEGQIRSLKFYNHFHYYEFKGGPSYKVNKQLNLALGMGSYQTYREGGDFVLPKNNDEFRIWPQVILEQALGKVKIEQRYRAEMRFTSVGYRNRFRYRFGLSFPLMKEKIISEKNKFTPLRFFANNEIFFTNREPYFERNRISGGIQYKPNASTTLLLGYLHQFDYKINDETGRDFLQIGVFLEFNKKSSPK